MKHLFNYFICKNNTHTNITFNNKLLSRKTIRSAEIYNKKKQLSVKILDYMELCKQYGFLFEEKDLCQLRIAFQGID